MDAAAFLALLKAGRPPANVHVWQSLSLAGSRVRRLPEGLAVHGDLDLRQCERLRFIGDGLCVERDLRIGGTCAESEISAGAPVLGTSRDKHSPLAALPDKLLVGGSLSLQNCTHLRAFPAHAAIGGSIFLSGCTSLAELPRGLRVAGDLTIIGGPSLTALPEGLHVKGDLRIVGTQITALPADLRVGGDITLVGCRRLASLEGLMVCGSLEVHHFPGDTLPQGFSVLGDLRLIRPRALVETPNDLDAGRSIELRDAPRLTTVRSGIKVGKDLLLRRCEALTQLPAGLTVPGRLSLAGCTALAELPRKLRVERLDLADCTALATVPDDLRVTAPIEVAGTSLRTWPKALSAKTRSVAWRGVPVEPEVVFAPETLSPERILRERNAELRRVMLERAGVEKVLARAKLEVVDEDHDPGGERRLVRLQLPAMWGSGDVSEMFLACACPSTGRRYLLRVPLAMTTCHAAAAWLAGFDDPSRYRPIKET